MGSEATLPLYKVHGNKLCTRMLKKDSRLVKKGTLKVPTRFGLLQGTFRRPISYHRDTSEILDPQFKLRSRTGSSPSFVISFLSANEKRKENHLMSALFAGKSQVN